MQLVDYGRLADTRITRDQHQFRPAIRQHAIESSKEAIDVMLTPVQFLGDEQPVRDVAFAEGEWIDPVQCLPICQTVPKILL